MGEEQLEKKQKIKSFLAYFVVGLIMFAIMMWVLVGKFFM